MKLKHTNFEKIIELISVIIILLTWVYLIISWGSLPDKIAGHYNALGVVDRWGNKNEVLFIPIMSIFLYILLTVVSFFPSIWNVPVKITEENKEFVYSKLKDMLILIKLQIIIIFSYIAYCTISIKPVGILFLPLFLILIFGTIIYYMIKVYKHK